MALSWSALLVWKVLMLSFGTGGAHKACGPGDNEGRCRTVQKEHVLLQNLQQVVKKGASTEVLQEEMSSQQLLHEKQRQDAVTQGIVQRWLLGLSLMIREGVAPADMIAISRKSAEDFDVDTLDLATDDNEQTLFQKNVEAAHGIMCIVRKGDCGEEYSDVLHKVVLSFSNFQESSLFQSKRRAKARAAPWQGLTPDPEILALMKLGVIISMQRQVLLGEDTGSARQQRKDAFEQLRAMSDDELLTYSDLDKSELAYKFAKSQVMTLCLHTTGSCSSVLTTSLMEFAGVDASISLLEVVVRPAVKVAMKLFGIPEFPVETRAERAAASKAYVAQRRLES